MELRLDSSLVGDAAFLINFAQRWWIQEYLESRIRKITGYGGIIMQCRW